MDGLGLEDYSFNPVYFFICEAENLMQQPEPVVPEIVLSPSPVEVPPKAGIWSAWPTFGLSVAIFSINSLVQVIVMGVFAILLARDGYAFSNQNDIARFLNDLISDGQMLSLAIGASALAGIAATLLFVKIRKGFSISEYLGLKAMSLKTVLTIIGIFVVIVGLSIGFGMIVKAPQGEDVITNAYLNTPWPVVFWLAVVVLGPIYEEFLFRGFLFVGLKQSALGTAGTIIITGLAFALLHAAQYGAAVIAEIYILGIVFGIVRWKTGSLWSTILLHGLWNLMNMVMITWFPTLGS
jgi:membrane protease YdiL (CAAX protease family)